LVRELFLHKLFNQAEDISLEKTDLQKMFVVDKTSLLAWRASQYTIFFKNLRVVLEFQGWIK